MCRRPKDESSENCENIDISINKIQGILGETTVNSKAGDRVVYRVSRSNISNVDSTHQNKKKSSF